MKNNKTIALLTAGLALAIAPAASASHAGPEPDVDDPTIYECKDVLSLGGALPVSRIKKERRSGHESPYTYLVGDLLYESLPGADC